MTDQPRLPHALPRKVTQVTFHVGVVRSLSVGMTDNSEFEDLPEQAPAVGAERLPHIESLAPQLPHQTGPAPGTDGGQKPNEMTGLVLLVNTVLGGLGMLYATTRSAVITLAAALLVFLITIVVLVVRQVVAAGGGRQGEEDRGGR